MESPEGRPRASPRECGGRRQTGRAAAGTTPDARSRPAFWLDQAATLGRPRWRHGRLSRPRRRSWFGHFTRSGLTIRTARLRRFGRLLGTLIALETLALERPSAVARTIPIALWRDRSAVARTIPVAFSSSRRPGRLVAPIGARRARPVSIGRGAFVTARRTGGAIAFVARAVLVAAARAELVALRLFPGAAVARTLPITLW